MINLYEYQKKYMEKVKPNWIYDCDTGVGKTIMALEHHQRYFKDYPVLIVAPAVKLNEGGWQRTIDQHYPQIQYEVLSFNKMALKEHWKNYPDHFLIIDEAHRIKDSTGVWGRSAYGLCKISVGYILLSATLTANGWEDSINYFKIFNLTKNKTSFLRDNAILEKKSVYAQGGQERLYNEIVGWKNENKLTNMWRQISSRLNKEDANDLPPITFNQVYFKRSTLYNTIRRDRIVGDKVYDSQMALRHGLRSSSNLNDKIKYLVEMLEDTDQNVIIFYNYDEEYEALKRAITKKLYICNGHVKHYPKKEEWDQVHNTVTIANYKSGSEAVEFTYGRIIIYLTPCDSWTDYYQSYGRVHRNGLTEKVTAYQFIAKGTIDEDIYDALNNKKDFNYDLWERKNL